jgi:hypothetical protein
VGRDHLDTDESRFLWSTDVMSQFGVQYVGRQSECPNIRRAPPPVTGIASNALPARQRQGDLDSAEYERAAVEVEDDSIVVANAYAFR